MNLKKLHENANWQKLSESNFRTKATNIILEQEDKIEKLNNSIIALEEELKEVKKIVGILHSHSTRLTSKIINQRIDDADNHTKQERSSRSVSQSR